MTTATQHTAPAIDELVPQLVLDINMARINVGDLETLETANIRGVIAWLARHTGKSERDIRALSPRQLINLRPNVVLGVAALSADDPLGFPLDLESITIGDLEAIDGKPTVTALMDWIIAHSSLARADVLALPAGQVLWLKRNVHSAFVEQSERG